MTDWKLKILIYHFITKIWNSYVYQDICKDMYAEIYNTLMKEIKGNLNRDMHNVLWLEVSMVWRYPYHYS